MMKRMITMLMVLVMLASMVTVPAFATCSHSTMSWVVDGGKCWQACDEATCDYTANIGNHADSADADFACDHCGEHIHSLTAMTSDADQHWAVCADSACTAGVTGTKEAHTWTVDTTNTDTTVTKYVCACGATKSEHAHSWATTLTGNDTHHWNECQNAGCTAADAEKNGYAEHTWTKDTTNSTATNTVYTCTCGKTKNEHVHVFATTFTTSAEAHWNACTDTTCTSTNGWEKHYNFNGDKVCDKAGCGYQMQGQTMTSLTVSGLTAPADGVKLDYSVSVAESGYGAPTVHWKRMTKANRSDVVTMTANNTYCAGCMYWVEIWVPHNYSDTISSTLNVTVDGVKAPFYTTVAAYNNAINTFEGISNVYATHFDTKNGVPTLVISVLYGKLAGTHAHTYDAAWITNGTNHYHICVGCDAVKDVEKHYDKDSNKLCDVCKYEIGTSTTTGTGTGTAAHTHAYGNDWVEDNANHWKQCTTCGYKTQTAKHADLNNTGKCDVCGFVMTTAAGHTHTYGSDWTETFAQHFKLCSCGYKTEIAAHADLNNSGLCDVCGYKMTVASTGSAVPNTGDSSNPMLWMVSMLAAVVGLTGTVVLAKKRREE